MVRNNFASVRLPVLNAFPPRLILALALGAALGPASASAASRVIQPSPGGIDPRPLIISSTNDHGVLKALGGGFQGGPFQVVVRTNLSGGRWIPTGPEFTNNNFSVTLTNLGVNCFYGITGPMPNYAGATVGGLACGQCHSIASGGTTPWDTWYDSWVQTRHARAFTDLVATNAANGTNSSCLPCHTVAYGYPGGYTPGNVALEGVQCENCHGPGGVRHRSGMDKRPAIEWSSMVCGGCHTGTRVGNYDEWAQSAHAKTTPDVAQDFLDPVNGDSYLFRCGVCHSGAMRAYMMVPAGHKPDGVEAGREGIVCVGCHDPHQKTSYGYQLRSPTFSTNNYSLKTSTNWAGFSSQYDETVNLCGQCHNARGAVWTDTSRPPHHSPQYNMLIGAIGEMPDGKAVYQPGGHALMLEKQCVNCHMTQRPFGGQDHPQLRGHSFEADSYESCTQCHPYPEELVEFTRTAISEQIQEVKRLLDTWATTKAPEALRTKYGALAWEYTNPGTLSVTDGTPGPSTAEQTQIPSAVKKARFDLYLVYHDGSYGLHNGPHTSGLLDAARTFVQSELKK